MDEFILDKNLKWFTYNMFKNIKCIGKGGFGTVYKAILSYESEDKEVALKCPNNFNLNEFFNEWKYHEVCLNSPEIIKLYGFTKDENTSNYMIVMDYANKSDLRGNLEVVVKSSWKQKLHILYKIISGLNEIHRHNLIHRDFHDGNILLHKDRKNDEGEEDEDKEDYKVYISELGLCQPVKSFEKDSIFGIMPFIAPEVLRGKPYTSANDIYSFSMIMWEFTSGILPFSDRTYNAQLSVSICKGERPEIIDNTPQCYINLMKKCWDEDPFKRPSTSEVVDTIKKWIILPYGIKVEDINEELKCNIMEFINAPPAATLLDSASKDVSFAPKDVSLTLASIGHSSLITKTHSNIISRSLGFTGRELNEILESESLDDCIVDI
ncbi:kinase-like domain-containing protein [Rhizophagus clarus]|uniref:Kinase-like domain-containing protein n=1 Tax=Rhizophagus clarus TaxID=94130 RepID=A0A8H3QSV2_9GLOM|nr:kinase-like domain-containing protein [Rhizophagus clarus]